GQVLHATGLQDRAAGLPLRVVAAVLPENPVHVGRAHHRAVVVVAQGEGLGQGPVEGDVFLGVVAHGERAVDVAVRGEVGEQPAVHRALVPGRVLVTIVVGKRRDPGGAGG